MFGFHQFHGLSSNNNSNIINNISHHLSNNTNNSNPNVSKPSFVERIKENVENVLLNSVVSGGSGSSGCHKENSGRNNIIINNNNNNNNSCTTNTMKWSSSSSSSLSSASDRRSVFYAEPMLVLENKISVIEATNLRVTLQNTEENLEMQVKKCENLISFFTNQIKSLTVELKNEKMWRAHQLTKIVKALLCFEAKLKNDQKLIRHQLYEKDSEINRLAKEIFILRERYGDVTEVNVNEVAQYCPKCRKQYYLIDTKDCGVQAHDHRFNANISPIPNMAALSSSEDGIPSFAEARRSKKYMSKRTSGTFRDYLRSRSNELKECGLATNFVQIQTTNNDVVMHVNGNDDSNNDNYDDEHEDDDGDHDHEKEIGTQNKSIEKKMNKINYEQSYGKRSMENNDMTYSSLINNLHGLKVSSKFEAKKCKINGDDNSPEENENRHEMDNIFHASSTSFLKKYNAEDLEKQQFETNDDWYASASDFDDSDNTLCKTYGQNTVNPVLECVNQILLQQSIDGILASSPSPEATEPAPHKEPNSRSKRVHFSTKNSMVHVPRPDSLFQCQPSADNHESILKEQSFNYESVYINEYEPIGSEINSSSHYVDMESKLTGDDRMTNGIGTRTKIPPALPPKPANLMKLRQALKISSTKLAAQSEKSIAINECSSHETISEPDYCSISEVDDVMKKIQIVAEVHKNADEISIVSDDAKTDATDETFADIPKLPNVAAIISPKKELVVNKFIAQDNYITKSTPIKLLEENEVSQILAEINSKKTVPLPPPLPPSSSFNVKISPKSPLCTQPSPILDSCPTKIIDDKIPIHAEFDWYNLDVEYGKLNPPDVIRETNNNNLNQMNQIVSDELQEANISIEYNLEKEFIINSSPDIIGKVSNGKLMNDENEQKNFTTTTVDRTNLNTSPPPKKTFESFLADTGLLTKPLPRKRKIYYSAPFV